jgi:hypothetical protein
MSQDSREFLRIDATALTLERRPPLAPLAPHQPRPARAVAHAPERRGVVAGQSRVQAGARAAERDQAPRGGSSRSLTASEAQFPIARAIGDEQKPTVEHLLYTPPHLNVGMLPEIRALDVDAAQRPRRLFERAPTLR